MTPLSTGAFGFPAALAAAIAIGSAHQFLAEAPTLEVRFVCADSAVYAAYAQALLTLTYESAK